MSRCFPYPPPGYHRTGAAYEALIESIKLQKETDKAKSERRKEKRARKEKKEKKEKEKRKNDVKVKFQNNQSQDSHKLQKVAGFTEAEIKGIKTSNELLEKSDLTEEYGQPIKPSYSSDSTQNSNKRRRDDDALLPDDSPSHGKPIKIWLLKKHKASDYSHSGEVARLETVPLAPSSNLDRTLHVSSNRNKGVPATSGREINVVQGIPLTQTKSNPSFERAKNSNPNRLYVGGEHPSSSGAKPILPSGSRKSDPEALKSTRLQQQIASFIRPVVPPSHVEREIPSSSLSRNIGVHGHNSVGRQQGPSNSKPGIADSVLNKPKLTATRKRPINEITVLDTSKLEKQTEGPRKVGLTGSEKKVLKKKAKYEKLIGSWAPLVFQAVLPDAEDWLSRRTESANSSISRGGVSCRELAATSPGQPRAQLLAEADIYALPYTVPF